MLILTTYRKNKHISDCYTVYKIKTKSVDGKKKMYFLDFGKVTKFDLVAHLDPDGVLFQLLNWVSIALQNYRFFWW